MIKKSEIIETELEKLKQKIGINFDIDLVWLPGTIKYRDGKQLLEEVVGDKIFIYVEELNEVKPLLAHGLLEWLLNQHSKRYRLLINKLIEVFEEIQYEEKEKIVDILSQLLKN